MSFSSDTKKELCKKKMDSKIEALLELFALSRMNASVRMRDGRVSLVFLSEHREVLQRVMDLVQFLYGQTLALHAFQNDQLVQTPLYRTQLEGEAVDDFLAQSALDWFGRYTESRERILGRLQSVGNGSAFLRGAFLGGGSLVAPTKSYHLEIVVPKEEDVWLLKQVLQGQGIPSKSMLRRGAHVVYLKDSDLISNFLIAIGAPNAMLRLEDAKAMKELRNDINRRVNAETANLDKSIAASFRQIEAINYLAATRGLDSLPENLAALCYVRLQNPDASLRDLGEMLQPPIGKSGVSHRMNRIVALAEEMQRKTL